MKAPIPIEETLAETIEEMVFERINIHGANESEAVKNAYGKLDDALEQLKTALKSDQIVYFIQCDDAFSKAIGEITSFYYRAGFTDAATLLNGGKHHDN